MLPEEFKSAGENRESPRRHLFFLICGCHLPYNFTSFQHTTHHLEVPFSYFVTLNVIGILLTFLRIRRSSVPEQLIQMALIVNLLTLHEAKTDDHRIFKNVTHLSLLNSFELRLFCFQIESFERNKHQNLHFDSGYTQFEVVCFYDRKQPEIPLL